MSTAGAGRSPPQPTGS